MRLQALSSVPPQRLPFCPRVGTTVGCCMCLIEELFVHAQDVRGKVSTSFLKLPGKGDPGFFRSSSFSRRGRVPSGTGCLGR